MDATCFSETSVDLDGTTWRYVPENKFAWLTVSPEDGADMVLRNIGWFALDYTALCPRKQIFSGTSLILKMEATCSFESSVDFIRTIRCYIWEDKFAWLPLNREDGGGMLLRNFGWLAPDYMALYPRWCSSWRPPLWQHQTRHQGRYFAIICRIFERSR